MFGLFIKETKLLIETFKDFEAYSTLSLFDFTDINDSNACAIASNPAEAFIILVKKLKNQE